MVVAVAAVSKKNRIVHFTYKCLIILSRQVIESADHEPLVIQRFGISRDEITQFEAVMMNRERSRK